MIFTFTFTVVLYVNNHCSVCERHEHGVHRPRPDFDKAIDLARFDYGALNISSFLSRSHLLAVQTQTANRFLSVVLEIAVRCLGHVKKLA